MTKEELYTKAAELAGRPVEVEKLTDGQFIALWMCFDVSPPKPAPTEEEALQNFIDKMLQMPKEPDTI